MNRIIDFQSTYWKSALQMCVAVTVAISIYKIFNLTYGYWLALSTIITIRATTGASVKRARERLAGTIMGVLIGVALINLFPHNHWLIFTTVPILIFLAVYLFNSSYTYSIFFTSILLILLLADGSPSPWHFAFFRIFDTAIGLLIGLSASYLLWPNASRSALEQNLQQTIQWCQDYFNVVTRYCFTKHADRLYDSRINIASSLFKSINVFKELSYEPGIMKVTAEAVYAFIVSVNIIHNTLLALDLASRELDFTQLSSQAKNNIEHFVTQLNHGFNQIAATFTTTQNATEITFDFNLLNTDIFLLGEHSIKTMLINRSQNDLGLILFAHQLKKLAFELKYMNQAVQQLTSI